MIPWLSRTVYRIQEAAMHRPTFAMLAEIERTQWLTRDGVETYQAQRLNQLLQTALAHSPWHAERIRAAGLEPAVWGGTLTLADLARLPTMNKRDARDNVEQLVWRSVPGGVFKYTTGGSSGEPLIFYFGRSR
jgi:phenylacetate-CoA ligase